MLTALYYICWALMISIYLLFIFTVFKFYQKKKSLIKYFIPAAMNCVLSFIGNFVIFFSIIGVFYDLTHLWLYLLLLLGANMFMVFPNMLLYRLHYKKKNKLTLKEYAISSIYGLLTFILYIIQINVLPR